MVNLLIGGLVTLVVTCLVQVMVIPLVQERSRRRERWEKDLVELSSLLEYDLLRAMKRFDIATIEFTSFAQLQRKVGEIPEGEEEWFRQGVKDAKEQAQDSFDEVEDLVDKIMHFYRRVYLIGSQSVIWDTVFDSLEAVESALNRVNPYKWMTDLNIDVEKYKNAIDELIERGMEAGVVYGEITESIRLSLAKGLRSRIVDSGKIDWESTREDANPIGNEGVNT